MIEDSGPNEFLMSVIEIPLSTKFLYLFIKKVENKYL
jgi:hypothetical protein